MLALSPAPRCWQHWAPHPYWTDASVPRSAEQGTQEEQAVAPLYRRGPSQHVFRQGEQGLAMEVQRGCNTTQPRSVPSRTRAGHGQGEQGLAWPTAPDATQSQPHSVPRGNCMCALRLKYKFRDEFSQHFVTRPPPDGTQGRLHSPHTPCYAPACKSCPHCR